MKILKSKRWMALLISIALIIALGMTFQEEPQKIKIGGTQITTYTIQKEIEVGDTEGHIVYLSKMEGFNKCAGEHKFMDGAQAFTVGFGDYIKGNGKHWGYNYMSLNGDMAFVKYKGKTTTTFSPKGKLVVTLEGTFTFEKGKGKYENIQGGGTYKAKVAPGNIVINKWEGEYFIKK